MKKQNQIKCKHKWEHIVDYAETLAKEGLTLITGGTDNHLMVLDLRPQGVTGKDIADTLETVGIVVNRNSIPHDTASPFNPSGIRIGTPAVTTRGMKEKEMKKIGTWIAQIITKGNDAKIRTSIAKEVAGLCRQFPVPD